MKFTKVSPNEHLYTAEEVKRALEKQRKKSKIISFTFVGNGAI